MRRKRGPATITDVARAAGVSRATAARALGGYGYVSEQVRVAVAEAAARLRYRPNAVAKSMSTGETRTLAIVVADIGQLFFADLVRGFTDVARAAGFDTVVLNTDEHIELERDAVQVAIDKRLDGVALTTAARSRRDVAHLVELEEAGIPLVLADRVVEGFVADAVLVDNRTASASAVLRLVERGHRRIGLVWGPSTAPQAADRTALLRAARRDVWTSAERFRGYLDAHDSAGLVVDTSRVVVGERTFEAATSALLAMLRSRDRPTALFATEGTATLAAVGAVRAAGLRCPDDVAVIGFDDTPWAAMTDPALTMLDQPARELGRLTARRLLDRIEDASLERTVQELEIRLIERASDALITGGGAAGSRSRGNGAR